MNSKFKFIVGVILILGIQGCYDDKSKKQLLWTNAICDKLFVETYTIYGGGAVGGDRVSQYLTDSSNFSIYVGTFVQGYGFNSYECLGDSILIHKVTEEESGTKKIENTQVYLLTDLIKQRKFE